MRIATFARVFVMTMLVFCIVGEETETRGSPVAFQADVSKMLDILINSLYTNREIFLREIISNASDALDKIRFMYLTNKKEPKNSAGEEPTMDIRIRVDREKKTFTMQDGGVGMTKEELAANLGSLGSSGTKRFLEKMKESNDANLIGQFGVGFYSVFLVAERVKVASKSDDSDKQWVWESTGDGNYFLYEDERGNTLGRGTELTLEMKKDADEYVEMDKIKNIIHRYSEFIHFPIYLETTKIERVPKEKPADEEKSDDGEVKDEDEDKKKEEEFEEVTKKDWELVNDNQPIWTRSPSNVTEEEYNKFYKSLTKDYDDPMFYSHFSAEGEVEFKALLFIPGRAPYNVFDTSITHANIRLYVRRVFITDEFKDLLPRFLNFIKGVVDSDDLPLNVSREVLQESRILKIIKKKLVRKALTMLSDIAANDKRIEEKEESENKDDEEKDDDAPKEGKQLDKITFPTFWNEFGKNLRLGMIEDGNNRARLTKLLRYKTSKSKDKLASLDDYVDRMGDNQKYIYFLTGESVEKCEQSPVLEDAKAKDLEVIYMTDAIDEYVVGHVTDYNGKKLVNLAKEQKEDRTKKEKAIAEKRKEKYEPLIKWWKELLGDRVTKITLTSRKISEPLILSSPQHGVSAGMQRIMKAQTLGEKNMDGDAKQVLELNYLHPLIDDIFKRVTADDKDSSAKDLGLVLYDTAALQNGFEVPDTLSFGKRVGRLLKRSVDLAPDAPLIEEDLSEYDVEDVAEEEKEEEKKEDL